LYIYIHNYLNNLNILIIKLMKKNYQLIVHIKKIQTYLHDHPTNQTSQTFVLGKQNNFIDIQTNIINLINKPEF